VATGIAPDRQPLYTIGHGTAPIDAFVAQLRGAGITSLVDVRRFPGSRRNPQYGSEALAESLRSVGITYRHDPDLGGRRSVQPESPNRVLRNESFRAYADYMASSEFHAARSRLLDEAAKAPTAVMCSETVWWRCHRRLIADSAVLVADRPVIHLIAGAQRPHVLTEGARRRGDDVIYDAA
jgi:uncharacterized protein (DUF488 family)